MINRVRFGGRWVGEVCLSSGKAKLLILIYYLLNKIISPLNKAIMA